MLGWARRACWAPCCRSTCPVFISIAMRASVPLSPTFPCCRGAWSPAGNADVCLDTGTGIAMDGPAAGGWGQLGTWRGGLALPLLCMSHCATRFLSKSDSCSGESASDTFCDVLCGCGASRPPPESAQGQELGHCQNKDAPQHKFTQYVHITQRMRIQHWLLEGSSAYIRSPNRASFL